MIFRSFYAVFRCVYKSLLYDVFDMNNMNNMNIRSISYLHLWIVILLSKCMSVHMSINGNRMKSLDAIQ